MYEYLLGTIPFVLVWVLMFYFRQDLRREMVYSSLICAPFGALDIFFIPAYWNPPRLMGLNPPLESFLFAFLVGGIAGVIYEETLGLRPDGETESRWGNNQEILVFGGISFIFFMALLPQKIMIVSLTTLLLTSAFILYHRRDLLRESVLGAALFTSLYFLILLFLHNLVFPGGFEDWWNVDNMMDIRVAGIPAGELLWAFFFGLMWSPLYESIKGLGLVEK